MDALVSEAIALAAGPQRAVLGVTGPPGVGKTTLAEALMARIDDMQGPGWVAHIPMDGFHLADRQLRRLEALDRKGAPDTFDPLGYAATLDRARRETDTAVYAPGFERTLEQPLAAALVVLPRARLVITEGNYLLLDHPAWRVARGQMDAVWFVTADETTRVERLVTRHVEFGKTSSDARAWVDAVDQRNAEVVSATSARADRIVVNRDDDWSFVE
ncbi:nucleoside/nucleotide kinase family protein [Williamsia sp.]|uniref:nucleoside/nucleotide kinase family protein n=1 Tax=Williamsia sp. TaxID=1872085 RepID=UPI001A2B7CC5|nr:nucleoside/nucleotide kinase family protein [Williamsia sp.]MBJ7289080.1 nucleoside/nucleotide kinase family protein [Williamsia sp.]